MTPTQLTLRELRRQGFSPVQVVEHFNAHAGVRQDLFECFDVLAVAPGRTIAVQTTSVSNVSSRIRKLRDHPNTAAVRAAGWEVRVHGWSQKKPGAKWVLARDEPITDYTNVEAPDA